MRNIYKNEEIEYINLDDSGIIYFNWYGSHQKNLELLIDWCGQLEFVNIYDFDNIKTKLIFQNISCFDLQANFKPYSMGTLDIYEWNYEIDENNKYNLYFKLVGNHNNFIKITCEVFYFEIIEKVKPQ